MHAPPGLLGVKNFSEAASQRSDLACANLVRIPWPPVCQARKPTLLNNSRFAWCHPSTSRRDCR